jgi:hypothetical protein
MSDFEANIRSVERAARSLPDGFTGWARLVSEGVHIHIVDNRNPLDPSNPTSADYVVPWHSLASWRCPIGRTIADKMVASLSSTTKHMGKP